MRFFALICPVLLAGLCAANTASAADVPLRAPFYTKAPAMVSYNSWTGFYVGGDIGGARTSNTGTWNPMPSPAAFGANGIAAGDGGSSAIGGLHAGYNWQFAPSWVTGVEGDWSWARAGGSFSQVWTANPGNAVVPGSFTNMSSRLDWVSSLRARLGYLVMPNILAYGTGGIALGRFDYAANNSNAGTYVTAASVSSTQVGYVLGGGLEWAVTQRWLLRGEYRFYSFGNAPSVVATSAAFPTFPSGYSWNKQNVNVAQLGLSYKF